MQSAGSKTSLSTMGTSVDDTTLYRREISPRVQIRNTPDDRVVCVRYYLDRPGYGLDKSAARFWFQPPPIVTPADIDIFLRRQQISFDSLLVEVYLDKFESYMMLEACAEASVEWDFSTVKSACPGRLDIRLTDLSPGAYEPVVVPSHANTTPVGLFSFSIMVGLESVTVLRRLMDESDTTLDAWASSMLFLGGLLQTIVGLLQVFRGNLYGATAFLVFGSIWASNGLAVVLGSPQDEWIVVTRTLFILAFSGALWKQTLVMNRLSTTLITLLSSKLLCQTLGTWSRACLWMQVVLGWATSLFAFYVFFVELTNQVYQRDVFPTYQWNVEDSPEEVFGAKGKGGTLESKAVRLRHALREASCDKQE